MGVVEIIFSARCKDCKHLESYHRIKKNGGLISAIPIGVHSVNISNLRTMPIQRIMHVVTLSINTINYGNTDKEGLG